MMKIFPRILKWIPEIYFITFALWMVWESYFASNYTINYPAIILAIVLSLQFFFKSKAIAAIVSSFLFMLSLYLILALFSDFSKKPIFDESGVRFLSLGGLLIATNITMCVLMFRRTI